MKFSKEEEYLRQKDKKLKKIIDKNGHIVFKPNKKNQFDTCLLYTSPSPRDWMVSRMPSSA